MALGNVKYDLKKNHISFTFMLYRNAKQKIQTLAQNIRQGFPLNIPHIWTFGRQKVKRDAVRSDMW